MNNGPTWYVTDDRAGLKTESASAREVCVLFNRDDSVNTARLLPVYSVYLFDTS